MLVRETLVVEETPSGMTLPNEVVMVTEDMLAMRSLSWTYELYDNEPAATDQYQLHS